MVEKLGGRVTGFVLAFCAILLAFPGRAEKTYRLEDFRVRDPFVVSAGGATAVRCIGHDYGRHTIRCIAAAHTLAAKS